MKVKSVFLIPIVFGVIVADYVGPQNGFRNGNGNGNSYGVPPDSIAPPQPQGGPYPPSGWKPAGRRLLLPGESRSAQQPIDSGYGQPPPNQYGPVNPSPSGPSVDNQYGPSVDNTGPSSNQYIPSTSFGNGNGGNGFSNGNGHNGNGGNGFSNGNGHNGNGGNGFSNGNGQNGNGFSNGNGHNGNGGNGFSNGNGHNGNGGNGFSNGNGQNGNGGNGFSNGNGGNGHGNGNGNGNGNSNGNGGTDGNGNGHNGGNGFSNGGNGNGGNGSNGNGNGKGGNGGSNAYVPAFHGAFPGGVVYPFIQHSVPAVLAFRPGNGAGHGSIYPVYQVPITPTQSGTGVIASQFPAGHGVFPIEGVNPSFQISPGAHDIGAIYPGIQLTGVHGGAGSHPSVIGQGAGLVGHDIGQYYALLANHQSQKLNTLGIKNGLINQQLQLAVGNAAHGNEGVPLSVF